MDKEILKIVVVGHVDHGKSTVIGRLLYETKSVPQGKIDRVRAISKEKGKAFEYAYLLDAFEEEQKQGITIDITKLQFFTEKRDYVIIDAPGHKEFLKNMISGAADAEAALLIIDANEGVQEQSRRHGYILSLLGIRKVYVLVNKMDLIGYSQERFEQIRDEMHAFLEELGVQPQKYIPLAALRGDNITTHSENMPWYTGEPVLEAIDLIEKEHGAEAKPLRFPIQDVYKFDSRRILVGRIESGTLRAGDEIVISPSGKRTRVKSIENWQTGDNTETVTAGMSVGITVEDEFFNKRGEVISHAAAAPQTGYAFSANLFWMGKKPLEIGSTYRLKLATQTVECTVRAISKAIDATTLAVSTNAAAVRLNDVAEIVLQTRDRISFDAFAEDHATGRFVLVDGYDVRGGGIIMGAADRAEVDTRLVSGDTEIAVTCFDDYRYDPRTHEVVRVKHPPLRFAVGDALPLAGETYAYPRDLIILDDEGERAAIVRGGRLEDIVSFAAYTAADTPQITTAGRAVLAADVYDFSTYRSVGTPV